VNDTNTSPSEPFFSMVACKVKNDIIRFKTQTNNERW